LKIIKSNNNKQAHRYQVRLDGLPRSMRKFLIENRSLNEWAGNIQFLEQILRMENKKIHSKTNVLVNKLFFDRTTGEPMLMENLIKSYDTVDWFCAISRKPIKARFNNFQLENFVHPEYSDVLSNPMVDSRILKSSVEFRKYCKKLLLEDQQEFLRIVKKGKKS